MIPVSIIPFIPPPGGISDSHILKQLVNSSDVEGGTSGAGGGGNSYGGAGKGSNNDDIRGIRVDIKELRKEIADTRVDIAKLNQSTTERWIRDRWLLRSQRLYLSPA